MIKIKNWRSFQSYKDRNPPWIRFSKTFLDDYHFQKMSSRARALLPMLWLLASEDKDPTSGIINISLKEMSFRLRLTADEISAGIEECVSSGFIEMFPTCNESVTKPYTERNKTVPPETETETETETEYNTGIKPSVTSKNFIRPTLEQVSSYCKERGNKVNPQAFIDHYESNGWRVGRTSMKSWQAAVRTWERNDFSKSIKREEYSLWHPIPLE